MRTCCHVDTHLILPFCCCIDVKLDLHQTSTANIKLPLDHCLSCWTVCFCDALKSCMLQSCGFDELVIGPFPQYLLTAGSSSFIACLQCKHLDAVWHMSRTANRHVEIQLQHSCVQAALHMCKACRASSALMPYVQRGLCAK